RAQLGLLRLLFKAGDAAALINVHDAEAITLARVNKNGGQRDVSACGQVLVHHELVIHFVNVIAGEDDHMLTLLAADGINILVNGVGCTQVPVFAYALHGRQDFNEFTQLARHHGAPAFTDVAIQGERLVPREDIHPAQVGVDAVGERDVDNAVVTAEGERGLGRAARQGVEAFPGAAGQQYSESILHRVQGQIQRGTGLATELFMLAEKRKPGAAWATPGAKQRRSGHAASSTLMRSDFRKRTSWALMLNSGSTFFRRELTSSGASSWASSSRRLKPMVASSTRKMSNPSSLIFAITCAIWSDSEREPLMA